MALQNSLFALFAASQPEAVRQRLLSSTSPFTILFQQVTNDSWFLITPVAITTKEVSDALGITDGANGGAVVVRVENYFGLADVKIWEWIAAKRGIDLDRPEI